MIKRPCYSLVYVKVSCPCSRGVDVPMCPWQVSWLTVWRFNRHDCKPSQRLNEASGYLRTQTGNSGATAADSHRFPFSPELRIVRLLVRHRGRVI